jgi:glycosyltransferase involved in cell wall biosynthesis
MKVCVIIPALNEEASIGRVVSQVPPAIADEIIVVDNGSTDATAAVAREAGARVVKAPERGYGTACMAGVSAAPDADVYAFMDGDGSDVPQRLGELVEPVRRGEAMLALGVRAGDVERGSMPWHQRVGNVALSALIRLVSGRKLRDLPSFKVLGADTLRSLALLERKHGWTAELIAKAAFRGLTIVELETGYRRRLGQPKVSGTVSGSLLAGFRIVSTIFRAWIAERPPSAASIGMVLGALVAVGILVVASVSLLRIEGSNYKVLVAVWLWALPVLGVFTLAGYLAGRGLDTLRRPGRRV